ncbi:hypothetical protein [Portibacter lacus]|nr:hypothetical protein [Portibacter lacus]
MSQVSLCLTCGAKAKVKTSNGEVAFSAIQEEEVFKKVGQLKKAMEKFKAKAEALAIELAELKSKKEV